jgi:hypothetical protein
VRFTWAAALEDLFAAPERSTDPGRRSITKFGIGFCPGCKRLRGAASLRCVYCGSAASVLEDA